MGNNVGSIEGAAVGESLGIGVGLPRIYVGFNVGSTVGAADGCALGLGVGLNFG